MENFTPAASENLGTSSKPDISHAVNYCKGCFFPSLGNKPALLNLPVFKTGVDHSALNQMQGTLTERGRDGAVLIAAQ